MCKTLALADQVEGISCHHMPGTAKLLGSPRPEGQQVRVASGTVLLKLVFVMESSSRLLCLTWHQSWQPGAKVSASDLQYFSFRKQDASWEDVQRRLLHLGACIPQVLVGRMLLLVAGGLTGGYPIERESCSALVGGCSSQLHP